MRKGFTLIEILIVMTLVILTLGGGVLKFNQTSRQRQIDNVAGVIKLAFNEARSNALAGKKDCSACRFSGSGSDCDAGVRPLRHWQVQFTGGSSVNLTTQGWCENMLVPFFTKSLPPITLPSGVTAISTSANPLIFRPRNGGVVNAPQCITVANSDNSYVVRMRITNSGLVESTNTCP